jgi:hypothetical protein
VRDSAIPRSRQGLLERVLVEFLGAGDLDRRDCRPLVQHHHQHACIDLEPDVLEESGAEQGLHRLRGLVVVEGVADLDREIAEDRAGLGSLDALHPDIADHEGLECEHRGRPGEHEDARRNVSPGCTARRGAGGREISRCDQAVEVVEQRDDHERTDDCEARLLGDLHHALGQGPAPHCFESVIYQMASVEHRHRQQIEDTEADADEREKRHDANHPILALWPA